MGFSLTKDQSTSSTTSSAPLFPFGHVFLPDSHAAATCHTDWEKSNSLMMALTELMIHIMLSWTSLSLKMMAQVSRGSYPNT
ncbi:hypothetical protein J5N97_006025 [Dioscorea zingiberensis]|uniref:Uncharacterized protein n=1 Tax=Dioscorea zingiberensis TaxID=325984 RepID=A0A9D5DAT9_9LILI|nr:hypothetical protein J5N97_006025 [Dioscorea zingiberensis]